MNPSHPVSLSKKVSIVPREDTWITRTRSAVDLLAVSPVLEGFSKACSGCPCGSG